MSDDLDNAALAQIEKDLAGSSDREISLELVRQHGTIFGRLMDWFAPARLAKGPEKEDKEPDADDRGGKSDHDEDNKAEDDAATAMGAEDLEKGPVHKCSKCGHKEPYNGENPLAKGPADATGILNDIIRRFDTIDAIPGLLKDLHSGIGDLALGLSGLNTIQEKLLKGPVAVTEAAQVRAVETAASKAQFDQALERGMAEDAKLAKGPMPLLRSEQAKAIRLAKATESEIAQYNAGTMPDAQEWANSIRGKLSQ